MKKIRVLIVDDEVWARKRIASLLKAEPDIEVVGECADGTDAVAKIAKLAPDLLFLDVQMPDIDGFDVLEAVGPEHMPVVIFATAYDQYAVRAFDAQALDYLLKPFDEGRFRRTLERARRELQRATETPERALHALLASVQERRKYFERLVVRSGGRIFFLKVSDVDWFEASANYVTVHVGRTKHLIRGTMTALERKLHPEQFLRIRRSAIVNLDRVKELQPWFKGEQVLVLTDGTRLTVGRAFRDRLERLLEKSAP